MNTAEIKHGGADAERMRSAGEIRIRDGSDCVMGSAEPTGKKLPKPRLLLVDDEQTVRDLIRTWLESDGYDVQIAYDGLDALEQFNAGSWDLVITDRVMPRLNGEELARAIRQSRPEIPIILITGSTDSAADLGGGGFPFDLIIRKPFRYEALRAGIASFRLRA